MDTFDRERQVKALASRRGMKMSLESSKGKRRWRISRGGVMHSGLTLDQAEQWLKEK